MRDNEQEIDFNSAVIAIDLLWTSSGLDQVDSHLMAMKTLNAGLLNVLCWQCV